MENKKQKTIYLNADDEINFIINKIEKCEAKEITLIIPENAVILQNLINLKVLRMNAKEFEKNISIVTIDEGYFEADNKIRDQASSIKDLISKSDADEKLNLDEGNKSSSNINVSVAKNLESKKSENKIKMRDIIEKKEVNVENAVKEIREEDSLQQKEFDQSKIEGANNNKNININKANDFEKSKKQSRNKIKINLLPSLSSKFFAGFIVVCFFTTLVILGFVLPKADLVITLKTEALTYDFEFVADELIDKIDSVSNRIPSEKVEITNEESGDYPATGKKHVTEKATGKIIIYNECSTGAQSLVANTRFLSKEGKIFRIKKSITMTGFTKPEDKVIPGSAIAEVVAEEPGESYNIGGTSFTIPKLQELNSWKFSCLYARSEQAMSGGVDKEVLSLSDSDYLTAKENLIKIVKEKNEKEFADETLSEYVFLEYLEESEEVKIIDDIKVGDIVDNFQMTVLVKSTALLVTKENLNNLIDEKISSGLSNKIELVGGSRSYEIGKVNKDENGKISIPVFVSQNSITKIDIDKIKNEIAGKNELELRKYFVNINGIKSTDVGFWPFWVKSIPSSLDKINITIDINSSVL